MEKEFSSIDVRKRRAKQRLLLTALQERGGIVLLACGDVGISRQTYYNWLRDDHGFREMAAGSLTTMQANLNRILSDRLSEDVRRGDQESIRTIRAVWGQEAIDCLRAGNVWPFN